MSAEFSRPLDHIRMIKANDPGVPRDRGVRIYKESPEGWAVQLRAPLGLGTFGLRDGKDFIVAHASCSLDDLRAMRDAIDALIEQETRWRSDESETGSGEDGDECPEAAS